MGESKEIFAKAYTTDSVCSHSIDIDLTTLPSCHRARHFSLQRMAFCMDRDSHGRKRPRNDIGQHFHHLWRERSVIKKKI